MAKLPNKPIAIIDPKPRELEAMTEILAGPPPQVEFLHSIFCLVGLPRSSKGAEGDVFERTCGPAHLRIERGTLWNGQKHVPQCIPYGPLPRQAMNYITTQALLTGSRHIDMGRSASEAIRRLGKDVGGGPRGSYTTFKKQMMGLSACNITLGYNSARGAETIAGRPIRHFVAWTTNDEGQQVMWPAELELSRDYFDGLKDHAVPLDPRAMLGLSDTALGMDIYTWLAYRLRSVKERNGIFVSWPGLRMQFGQEYKRPRAFVARFLPVLKRVMRLYPTAQVEIQRGGLLLRQSPPPVPETRVFISAGTVVDNQGN